MRHLRPPSWLVAHLIAAAVGLVAAGGVAEPAAPGAEVAPDSVLASWKGGQLLARDWLAAFKVKTPLEQRALATSEGRVQLLRDLERYALLIQEAERRGYAANVVVQDGTRKAAIEALMAGELAVTAESIPDADVAAEYQAQRAHFNKPALRRASLIVVAAEADARTLLRELRAANGIAPALRGGASATREQFGAVARTRSIDAVTRRQSGELGWFTREGRDQEGSPKALPAELVSATWALPRVGALAPRPLKVEGGYGVLLLTGEQPGMEMPYADAAGELREQLASRLSAQRVEQLVAQLRSSVKVELHPELLAPIVLDTKQGIDIPQGFPAHPSDPRAAARIIKPDKY